MKQFQLIKNLLNFEDPKYRRLKIANLILIGILLLYVPYFFKDYVSKELLRSENITLRQQIDSLNQIEDKSSVEIQKETKESSYWDSKEIGLPPGTFVYEVLINEKNYEYLKPTFDEYCWFVIKDSNGKLSRHLVSFDIYCTIYEGDLIK